MRRMRAFVRLALLLLDRNCDLAGPSPLHELVHRHCDSCGRAGAHKVDDDLIEVRDEIQTVIGVEELD